MANEFKPGDIVQLKSGGPKMTVKWAGQGALTKEDTVACMWFVGSKQEEGAFPPEALELATERATSVRLQRG